MLVQSVALFLTLLTLANGMLARKAAPRVATFDKVRFTGSTMRSAKPVESVKNPVVRTRTFKQPGKLSYGLATVPFLVLNANSSSDEEQAASTVPVMATTIDDYAEDWRNYSILWGAIKSIPHDDKWSVKVESTILRNRSLPLGIKMKLFKDLRRLSVNGPAGFISAFEAGLVYSYYAKTDDEKLVFNSTQPYGFLFHHLLHMAIDVHKRQLVDVPLGDPKFLSMFNALLSKAGNSNSKDFNIPSRADLDAAISSNPSLIGEDTINSIYKLHERLRVLDTNTMQFRKHHWYKIPLAELLHTMQNDVQNSKL